MFEVFNSPVCCESIGKSAWSVPLSSSNDLHIKTSSYLKFHGGCTKITLTKNDQNFSLACLRVESSRFEKRPVSVRALNNGIKDSWILVNSTFHSNEAAVFGKCFSQSASRVLTGTSGSRSGKKNLQISVVSLGGIEGNQDHKFSDPGCEENDEVCLAENPVSSSKAKVSTDNDLLRQHSAVFQTASLTQTLSGGFGRRMASSVGTASRVAPRFSRYGFFAGPLGFLMALAVAVAGLTSAIRNHIEQSRQIWAQNCRRCDGCGQETCKMCAGNGFIRWEGKLYHTDPCPACLGKGKRKCSSCLGFSQAK